MTGLEIALAAVVMGCAIVFCLLLFIYLSSNKEQPSPLVLETSKEEVKERELNISEPVLSFVETVKQNPKRFNLRKIEVEKEDIGNLMGYYRDTEDFYRLEDKQTSELWKGSVKCRYSLYQQRSYNFPAWLTRDECGLIYNTFLVIYKSRMERISQRKLQQTEKKDQKERNRLKEVYCNK